MLLKGPSRVIADLLAYQARVGKVRKVGSATFVALPGSMSRSTRWRCLHWRNELEALRAAIASLPPYTHWPSSPPSDAATPANSASERGETSQTTGHAREPGTYARHMLRIDHASLADIDELVALGSNLFEEGAAQHDTYIDLSWAAREGRTDFERLLGNPDSVVLIARSDDRIVGHLVGYTHDASPTRLQTTYAVTTPQAGGSA